jgi:hypothetical protein
MACPAIVAVLMLITGIAILHDSRTKRPPSKVHDPIGYKRYYSAPVTGWISIIVGGAILFLVVNGCK